MPEPPIIDPESLSQREERLWNRKVTVWQLALATFTVISALLAAVWWTSKKAFETDENAKCCMELKVQYGLLNEARQSDYRALSGQINNVQGYLEGIKRSLK